MRYKDQTTVQGKTLKLINKYAPYARFILSFQMHLHYNSLNERGDIQILCSKNIALYFLRYDYRTATGSTPAQDSHGERPLN